MPERASCEYKNLSQKWLQSKPDYNKQYCNVYLARLKEMTKMLEEAVRIKWGTKYPICKLHKLTEENHPKCVVLGTLFKNQKLKPSILKHLAQAGQLVPQPILTHFTDESDELYIEDELQRYLVVSCLPLDKLVTGITCALLGSNDDKGHFMVDDYTFAGFREQVPRPLINDDTFILFLSGLDFMNSAKFAHKLQLLEYWLSGFAGDLPNQPTSKIARIVIAGNSIRNTPEVEKPSVSLLSQVPDASETFEAVKSFDKFLYHLSQVIDVDVMPGGNDPSNHILPQKPMHYCMFPQAAVYKSVNQVSNPYSFSIDGVTILGSSGQPVLDVMKFSDITDPLEVLENCLKWNHLAPTAPDTLACYPFYDSDPFVLEDCPHLVFAGNQESFSHKECVGDKGQKVTLLSIPQFSNRFEVCLLNLKTMDCSSVTFE